MVAAIWVILGFLFVAMALSGTLVKRLPLTTAIIYLLVGVAIGPFGYGLFSLDLVDNAPLLEIITELAVVISLFTAALKLRTHLFHARWRLPLRLALISMIISVGLITFFAWQFLGLPLGAAIILGGVLSPTDPVLASDVQVANPDDSDKLRFSLTGEAGLNDSTAFPFVYLGLGLIGLRESGPYFSRWLLIDAIWAVLGGLVIGAVLGFFIGKLVIYLRQEHKEATGLDDLLALGLIFLSYGLALWASALAFLSVFAAGLALRQIEMAYTGDKPSSKLLTLHTAGSQTEIATDPEKAPAFMVHAVLLFNEQLERIAEVAIVLLVGVLLPLKIPSFSVLGVIVFLFLFVRPVSAYLALFGTETSSAQRWLISWFGVRGIGSLYYLSFAIHQGMDRSLSLYLGEITLWVMAVSIFAHGLSVTPLMNAYTKRKERHLPKASYFSNG